MPATGAPASGTRIPVIASFYPLFEFALQVGASRVAVRNLVPAGAEPHDYEPTPRDVVAVNGAKVLIYNGAGFEPWLQRLLPQIPASVVTVNAAEGIGLTIMASGAGRRRTDPHVWLDPVSAQRQVDLIAAGLAKADPAGKGFFDANAAQYRAKLAALHERIERSLAPCRRRVFVTSHAAFGYFAARYGLTQIAVAGLTPDAEPSAAKIREILRLVRQHDARVIYYETLVNPRLANAIAREVGARTRVLNPVEGLTDQELRQGKHYISIMLENLHNLLEGLDCP